MKVDNETYNYSCTVNNQIFEYELKIIARFNENLVQCPICGANECYGARDKFIWAEFENEKLAIHFEDGEFENYLSNWYFEGISEDEYKSLPNFLKDFNECKGWYDDAINPNTILDAIDFKNAMEVIKNSKNNENNDLFLTNFYPIIIEFVDKVIKENKVLNIIND